MHLANNRKQKLVKEVNEEKANSKHLIYKSPPKLRRHTKAEKADQETVFKKDLTFLMQLNAI